MLIILLLFVSSADYSSINQEGLSGQFIFLTTPALLILIVHIVWDLRKLYIPIVPFIIYSIFFYWISFVLLKAYSYYTLSPATYIASLYCYTSLIFSYFLLDKLIPAHRISFAHLKLDMQNNLSLLNDVKLVWMIGVVLSFFFTSLFFIKAGSIPMLAANPEIARVEAMKGAGTIQRLSYLPMYFAIFSLSIIMWLENKKITRRQIFIILLFVFYNMLTGPRSYALWVLIYLFISINLLNSDKIKIVNAAFLSALILLVVAIVGGIRYSGASDFNLEDTIIRFINRIYMNPVNANRIVEAFQYKPINVNSFIIEVKVLLPGYQPDLGTYLKEYVGANFDGGGITVPLPAEGFMNMGIIGSIFYGIIFAIILKLLDFLITKIKNPFHKYILLVLLSLQFMGVVTMGISGIIIKTTIPTLVTFIIIMLIIRILKIHRSHSVSI